MATQVFVGWFAGRTSKCNSKWCTELSKLLIFLQYTHNLQIWPSAAQYNLAGRRLQTRDLELQQAPYSKIFKRYFDDDNGLSLRDTMRWCLKCLFVNTQY